jgi:PAS domain-containing protein
MIDLTGRGSMGITWETIAPVEPKIGGVMPVDPDPTIPVPDEGQAGQKGPPTPAALPASELRYRRLFEAARDGIFILDANPFMSELLGYDHPDFLGKELWEIGLFDDQAAYEALIEQGYIRYEHLPLSTKAGKGRRPAGRGRQVGGAWLIVAPRCDAGRARPWPGGSGPASSLPASAGPCRPAGFRRTARASPAWHAG